jgi:hypothetical protein
MRKRSKLAFFIIITMILVAVLSACREETNEVKKIDYSVLFKDSQIVWAKTYYDIPMSGGTIGEKQGWKNGMVGGNGRTGFITNGAPYSDVIIYQNIDFIMPTPRDRNDIEDLTWELETVRQSILNYEIYNTSDTEWNYSYSYHPGHQLRISSAANEYDEYCRATDYETGEVSVRYSDSNGYWSRKTFSSRTDGVTVTAINSSDTGSKVNITLSIDNPSGMPGFGKGDEANIQYKELAPEDCSYIALVGHYPDYEGSNLRYGGYAGVTYVVTIGGTKALVYGDGTDSYNVAENPDPSIRIEDADAVYLITALDRTEDMGALDAFQEATDYALLDTLVSNCLSTVNKYGGTEGFDYFSSLTASAAEQKALFSAASLRLGSADDINKNLSNEDLIGLQREDAELSDALVERVYKQGRYAMICCAGYTMSRLSGMWTGEWNSGWRGIYTMDANVNLQSSGMNTANLHAFGEGYINFVWRQVEDWETNALKIYGMSDALLCPVNTDGDRALNSEYCLAYPFEYWNSGASWMIQPIYEYWQCYGDTVIPTDSGERQLVSEILLPLLKKNANFWTQLLTPEYYTDSAGNACYSSDKSYLNDGEKYLIIPSYSPENTTGGSYQSTLAVNAAMDISAARYSLDMAIEIETLIKSDGWQERVDNYHTLINNLPEYTLDETGAVMEWCASGYQDNNEHRHISHLYCAWPAFETQSDTALAEACAQAIDNRNSAVGRSQGTQSHGWLHKGLVYARLKDEAGVYDTLYKMFDSRLFYDSCMTDHNTDRKSKVYCTDSSFGLIGIINETLLYSDSGVIEALPALPSEWTEGAYYGLIARTRAEVSAEWSAGVIKVTVKSYTAQTIKISCAGSAVQMVEFNEGESKTFTFNI